MLTLIKIYIVKKWIMEGQRMVRSGTALWLIRVLRPSNFSGTGETRKRAGGGRQRYGRREVLTPPSTPPPPYELLWVDSRLCSRAQVTALNDAICTSILSSQTPLHQWKREFYTVHCIETYNKRRKITECLVFWSLVVPFICQYVCFWWRAIDRGV